MLNLALAWLHIPLNAPVLPKCVVTEGRAGLPSLKSWTLPTQR
jgi:hypothetical protein